MQVFIGTQVSVPVLSTSVPTTRNRGALEDVFIKATRIEALSLGLLYFLGKEMSRIEGEDGVDLIKWAAGVAMDTLRTGMDVVPNL
jgi:nucleolar MIF4G domain-containing protein 1